MRKVHDVLQNGKDLEFDDFEFQGNESATLDVTMSFFGLFVCVCVRVCV